MNAQDFAFIENALNADADIKENLRDEVHELEKHLRHMSGTLNRIHSTPRSEIPALLATVEPGFTQCRESNATIAALIPPNAYWRWKDIWARHLQTAVYVASLIEYLSTGQLLSLDEASTRLGFQAEWKDRYYIAAEDYLQGVISMVNELSRLAVNSVTMGNFEEPLKISAFVKELFSAFSLLNLKNDGLRRKFDSLKYDIKKLEEIVYDISLRQLVKRDAGDDK
ncbi:Translin [Exidia glandulosa HHB12029]|uniref:Translin n=1 Tax=Exidia glandulosa HHB12029 TaxID=1314781 RepID=A0A165M6K8_EXIGL|nr:Translin [Exidia glandulosa HHB12029]